MILVCRLCSSNGKLELEASRIDGQLQLAQWRSAQNRESDGREKESAREGSTIHTGQRLLCTMDGLDVEQLQLKWISVGWSVVDLPEITPSTTPRFLFFGLI